jgi:CspA family cold shock protein
MGLYNGKNLLDEGAKQLAQASAKGKVKWYNGTKGYGFVTLDNGEDAFCHASVLKEIGHQRLPIGATIVCDLSVSRRGMTVRAIHKVDLSTAQDPAQDTPQRPLGGGQFGDAYQAKFPAGPTTEGKVKFFNHEKGFGYVQPKNGGADIFLHVAALRRSGLQTVMSEQPVRFSTCHGKKGEEVARVELI